MKHHNKPEPAAFPEKAGYQPTEIARAWLAYCSRPKCQKARKDFAERLDELLKSRLPDGRCTGAIKGLEGDIRQEAYLLLVGRYLAGNPTLLAATFAADAAEADNQLRKSAAAAIRSAAQSMAKALVRERQLIECGADPDAIAEVGTMHPANRTSLWELPFEQQRLLVFAALESAVTAKLLGRRGAGMLREMVEKGMTQSELARARGISRQSVQETLALVRKLIASLVEAREMPLR